MKLLKLCLITFLTTIFFCDDRDPPWVNKDINQLILDKNHA